MTFLTRIGSACLLAALSTGAIAAPIDLNTWGPQGALDNERWTLSADISFRVSPQRVAPPADPCAGIAPNPACATTHGLAPTSGILEPGSLAVMLLGGVLALVRLRKNCNLG